MAPRNAPDEPEPTLEPRLEAALQLSDGRALGLAEYGVREGRPVLWFHGTPGGRRQVPPAARRLAEERGVRLIALERPGVGASTPHLHRSLCGFADDVGEVAERLGLERFGLIGLSGGGPYVLACAHELDDRVVAGAVLGGVAPAVGEEAAGGGAVGLARRLAPALGLARQPLGGALRLLVRALGPLGSPVFDLYLRTHPEGDQRVFRRPEMKEMFLQDLILAGRQWMHAPVYDLLLFTRDWGFSLRDVRVPIRFWHGDADHIVPLEHGLHVAGLVPDSELRVRPGEGHMGNLDAADEIFDALLGLWPDGPDEAPTARPERDAGGNGGPKLRPRARRAPRAGAAPAPDAPGGDESAAGEPA